MWWTDIIIAAATAAVAWTAWQSLTRERERIDERRRVTEARMSAIAYALRRQIRSWWDWPGGSWPSVDRGAAQKEKAEEVIPHFDTAEERVEDLLALAPHGSPKISRAVRASAVRFYRATKFINELWDAEPEGAEYDPSTRSGDLGELPREVRERFTEAHILFIRMVDYLDEIIDGELQEAAKALPD